MTSQVVPPQRPIQITALLAVPILSTLALLVATGALAPGAALLAGPVMLAGAGFVVRLYESGIRAAELHLSRLADVDESAPAAETETVTGPARPLIDAIHRLDHAWRLRNDRLTARIRDNEAILEALPNPLILIGAGGQVLRANGAACALLGERLVGRELAASLRNPVVLGAIDAVLGDGASRRVEFTLPVPVERGFEAQIQLVQRFRAGSTVILTLHDITAARRSEQMRADFVANASHELRTPLSTLLGFVETLRGPARDDADARDRFLGIMQDQAARMARLIDDLLSLSRIEQDEHMPPTGRVDVAGCVHDVVDALALKAERRGIRLRVDAAPDLPDAIGDGDQLTQVFQNLVSNAIKYSREHTEVTVTVGLADPHRALRNGRTLVVTVTDRGEGIARTHLPRLTERFYRVDAARSRALGGTGLGLAIVKHILNRHRGRLFVDSELGKGSAFTVHLPAAGVGAGA